MTEVLLLHGWGFGAAIWQPILEHLDPAIKARAISLPGYDAAPLDEEAIAMDYVLKWLADRVADSTVVIGWSLGGLLAVELARLCPTKIRAVGMIAALPCFHRQSGWPAGWENRAVTAVYARLQQDAMAACRYVAALAARGDNDGNRVRRILGACAVPRREALERDLGYLIQADCRRQFAELEMPVHVWLGSRDALIGGDPEAALRVLRPRTRIHMYTEAGHGLPLSRSLDLANELELLSD